MADVDPKYNIKIPILGNFQTGKTSILYTFTEQEYEEAPIDIGRDYISYDYTYEGETYRVDFWDTNGSEKYGRVTSRVSECDGGVFVCAYDAEESMEGIHSYLANIKYTENINGVEVEREPPFIVICSKHDLVDSGEAAFGEDDFNDFAGDLDGCVGHFGDVDYCNWDAMYKALKKIMDEAIKTHLKWYEERP